MKRAFRASLEPTPQVRSILRGERPFPGRQHCAVTEPRAAARAATVAARCRPAANRLRWYSSLSQVTATTATPSPSTARRRPDRLPSSRSRRRIPAADLLLPGESLRLRSNRPRRWPRRRQAATPSLGAHFRSTAGMALRPLHRPPHLPLLPPARQRRPREPGPRHRRQRDVPALPKHDLKADAETYFAKPS